MHVHYMLAFDSLKLNIAFQKFPLFCLLLLFSFSNSKCGNDMHMQFRVNKDCQESKHLSI